VPVTLDSVVLNLVDRSRQTVSHGRLIASTRTLRTTVWFAHGPATSHPLIVFAHGYSVGVAPYVRVCQAWARAGFVVAAPSFPLTDASVAGQALDEADMVNQPADVSFVISALVSANRAPGDPLNARIDPQRVAVAGHSDGADTALAVTYLPQDRDPRIRAAVVDAPDPLPLPAGAARLTSTVPLLLLHGDGDAIAPYAGSLRVLTQLTTPGWFITLRGADHLSPIKGPSSWTAAFDRVTTDFFAHAFGDPAVLNATLAIDAIGSPVTVQKIG
jgi:predicted dienelactone hydrolase